MIRENLELGCKHIKADIQREAISGIQNEENIMEAISKREEAIARGELYRNYSNIENFNRLPELLKPSEDGLTPLEFQVYKDFDEIPDLEQEILESTNNLLNDDDEPAKPPTAKGEYNQNQQKKLL